MFSMLNAKFSVAVQKFRDAEAKVVGCIGMNQWECELYVSYSLSFF